MSKNNRNSRWPIPSFKELINEVKDRIDGANLIFGLLANAGLNAVLAYISPSAIMRSFMGVAALFGFILSTAKTAHSWCGVAKSKRSRLFIMDLIVAGLCALGVVLVIWILDADTARKYSWAESAREFLLSPGILANLTMALLTGTGTYF